jgi:hypothetical protein
MADFQQWGVCGWGRGGRRKLAPPYCICRGELGEGGGRPCSCLLSTCMQPSFSFLFLLPSFCCGGLFRYKKARGKPYRSVVPIGQDSLPAVADWLNTIFPNRIGLKSSKEVKQCLQLVVFFSIPQQLPRFLALLTGNGLFLKIRTGTKEGPSPHNYM